jgi:hypothetical protein
MYSNIIFNYIEKERGRDERIKKENSKPEHPSFVLDTPLPLPPTSLFGAHSGLALTEWHDWPTFSYFEKMKVGLCDLNPVCMFVYPSY